MGYFSFSRCDWKLLKLLMGTLLRTGRTAKTAGIAGLGRQRFGHGLFLLFKVRLEVIEASDGNVTAHGADGQDGRDCRIGKAAFRAWVISPFQGTTGSY